MLRVPCPQCCGCRVLPCSLQVLSLCNLRSRRQIWLCGLLWRHSSVLATSSAGSSLGAATLIPVSSFASPGGAPAVFAPAPASRVVSSSSGSSTPGFSIPHPSCITLLVYSHCLTELQGFPDPVVAATVLVGIREGFRLRFQGNRCKSSSANMRSPLENPLVVDQYFLTECSYG